MNYFESSLYGRVKLDVRQSLHDLLYVSQRARRLAVCRTVYFGWMSLLLKTSLSFLRCTQETQIQMTDLTDLTELTEVTDGLTDQSEAATSITGEENSQHFYGQFMSFHVQGSTSIFHNKTNRVGREMIMFRMFYKILICMVVSLQGF